MSKKKADAAENVRVLVRCRPLSEKEKNNGNTSCVDLDIAQHTVTVNPVVGNPDRFTFDATINNTFSQKDIFNQYIMPLVDSVLDGFNATVFAYGQSGSGKTHTMTGVMGDEEMEGVIPRCFKYIFDHVKETKEAEPNKVFSMYVSFVELYNGKVRDLLAAKQVTLDVRESKDKTF
ncbi:OSM3-like kinesin, partial [Angomonas deanei]